MERPVGECRRAAITIVGTPIIIPRASNSRLCARVASTYQEITPRDKYFLRTLRTLGLMQTPTELSKIKCSRHLHLKIVLTLAFLY